jgi:uncharacterized protein (DUF342 family)
MQAELKAIENCVDICLADNPFNKSFTIISDCRSAIMALNKANIDSLTVSQCVGKLNILSDNNRVDIAWCPGHRGIIGNEKADELAKQGIENELIDINVAVGEQLICNKLIEWGHKQALKSWNNHEGKLKHSKICITPFDQKLASNLLTNTRANIRTIVGLLTGHICTNLYLKRIGKANNELCRFCKETNSCETVLHFLQDCLALARARIKHFHDGKPPDALIKTIKHKQLLKFAKESGIKDIILNTFEK